MRVGLVLEGGAMRGMYTAGVLDVFWEHGIKADCVVGVSAGAVSKWERDISLPDLDVLCDSL